MIRPTLLSACLSALAALTAPLDAQTFRAAIDDAQVPPAGTGSAAAGTATLQLDPGDDALGYSIAVTGLDLDGLQTPDPGDDLTALHIHRAAAGATGPIVFGIVAPGDDPDDLVIDPVAGTITGAWEATDVLAFGGSLAAELANLEAGELYLNFHTPGFPAGEVRGQILPARTVLDVPGLGRQGAAFLALLLAGAGVLALRRLA